MYNACIKLISTQLQPLAALLARPTYDGLWSQIFLGEYMSCGRTCFLKYMSFRITGTMGRFALGKSCFLGGHVLQECTSFVWHIFQDDVSYWNACFTGGQILLEGMSYKKSCLTGMPVLHEYML